MRKQMMVLAISAATLAVAPACATKGFVRESVGEVNEKVGTLSQSLGCQAAAPVSSKTIKVGIVLTYSGPVSHE